MSDAPASRERRPTILVVEDDPDVRDTLVRILVRFGYDVQPATDGARALSLVRDGLRPDLVILDLVMPNMDGIRFRAAQVEHDALASIPTIVITASERLSSSAASGAVACFRKPFDMGALLETIKRHC